MTPVPKNLNRQQALNWRREVARGANPVAAASRVARGPVRHRDGGDSTSLSRFTRGAQ